MKKFTKIAAIVLVVMMMFTFAACQKASTETDPMKVVVAKVGDKEITRMDLEALVEYYADYYASYYGVTAEEIMADEEMETTIKNICLDSLVEKEVVLKKAKELGLFELNAEDEKSVKESVEALENSIEEALKTKIEEEIKEGADIKDIDAEITKRWDGALEEYGFTLDEYAEEIKNNIRYANVSAEMIKDVAATEEEAKEEYTKMIETQKSDMEVTPLYFSTYDQEGTAVYVPEGVLRVWHILIKVPESVTEAVGSVYSEEGAETAFAMMETELAKIKPKAEEALKKAKAGEDFVELMKEYSDDETFNDEAMLKQGFIVVKDNNGGYYDEFQLAAEKLKKGQVSDLVVTPYGYHIVYCAEEVEAGEVPFEDVKEGIIASLTTTKQEEKWTKTLEEWIQAANVQYFKQNMFTQIIMPDAKTSSEKDAK